MRDSNAPLTMLDEAAITAAELRHDPYDFAFVDHAMPARLKEQVLDDAPAIPDRGSYALPHLRYGDNFAAVVRDLLSERFRHLVEEKFDVDLSKRPPCIVMMGNTTGHYNEGYAHPDSKHKIITRSSPCCSASRARGRMSAGGCACCAATTARTAPSSSRPSSAAC